MFAFRSQFHKNESLHFHYLSQNCQNVWHNSVTNNQEKNKHEETIQLFGGKYEIKCFLRQEALYSYADILFAEVKSVLNTCLQYMVLKAQISKEKGKEHNFSCLTSSFIKGGSRKLQN